MKRVICTLLGVVLGVSAYAQVMSEKYQRIWGDSVQMSIDREIEKNRKADAVVVIKDAAPGTEVKVEQVSHEFIFGSNIFLFGQLDSPEKNHNYELEECESTVLCLDYRHNGIGSNSCGPALPEELSLNEKQFAFSFRIKPVFVNNVCPFKEI